MKGCQVYASLGKDPDDMLKLSWTRFVFICLVKWYSELNLAFSICSGSTSRFASGNEVIGIDLGTTNSCVAVMEGKVRNSPVHVL